MPIESSRRPNAGRSVVYEPRTPSGACGLGLPSRRPSSRRRRTAAVRRPVDIEAFGGLAARPRRSGVRLGRAGLATDPL